MLITSNFDAIVDIPESPDSCSAIIDPLFLEVNQKITELTEQRDCIDFSTNLVCT